MDTADIRNGIFSTPLVEAPVTIAGWNYNLIIRELSGKAGSALIKSTSNDKGVVDQEALIAGIIMATLRNADDPQKSLIFGMDTTDEPNPIYRDQLMGTGLSRVMEAAKQSITLSGLDDAAATAAAKKNSSSTVVESSHTTLPLA